MRPNRRDALGTVAALAGLASSESTAWAQSRSTPENLSGYAVNLDTWFKQVPFEQRFPLARQHGFKFIEFWTVDRGNGTKASAIRGWCDANGLSVTQFAPAWPNFGDPAKHGELLKVTEAAIADARTLGTNQFTVTGHSLIDGMSREAQLAGYLAGLMRMAPMLEVGVRHAITPDLRLFFDGSGIHKGGGSGVRGSIYNASAGVEWFPVRNIGVSLAYAVTDVDLKRDDAGVQRLRLKFQGPVLAVKGRF